MPIERIVVNASPLIVLLRSGRCARTLGISILGTGGVLVLAKRRGFLQSVEEELNRLQQAGLWLSPAIVNLLLKEAGE